MRLRLGTSTRPDVAAAAAEAVKGALEGSTAPAFALVFATFDYPAEPFAQAVTAALGAVPWAGCSTFGVLCRAGVLRRGVGVAVLDGADLRVGVGIGTPIAEGARAGGRAAAAQALKGMPAPPRDRSRAVVLLCDALSGQAVDVVRGAAEVAGAGVAWAGGGTGVLEPGTRAALFANGLALHDHVVAVALDFPARVGTGIHHGWRAYGPPMMITRAAGTLIHELEYRPAFEAYRQVAAGHGELVTRATFGAFATAHPLGIPQATGEHLIRDQMGVEPDGSIRCLAEVPDGALLRVMEGDTRALVEAAGTAAAAARGDTSAPLGGAFIFDCISRFFVMGEAIGPELAAFGRALGPDVPFLGCLSFGEVGAFGVSIPQFHNKTAVVLGLPG